MKKFYVILSAAALLLIGCGKKSNVDVKAEFDRMYTEAESAFEFAADEEEAMQIYNDFIEDSYELLYENMGAPYTDTLFMQMASMLSVEQRTSIFERMPKSMLENETIARIHEAYLAELKTAVGSPYLDFTAVTPEGKELALSQLVGQTDYVLIDFWASWCGPCRRLIPVLKEIYGRMPNGRLQILSCSVDKDEEDWRKALTEEQMPWLQTREDAEHECSDLYGVQYIPYTVLIDKEGHIVGVNLEEPELENILLN